MDVFEAHIALAKKHGIAAVAMPTLLAGMEDKRWKTKAGCIEVLKPCLQEMAAATPSQLAECLPQTVAKLAEADAEAEQAMAAGAQQEVRREDEVAQLRAAAARDLLALLLVAVGPVLVLARRVAVARVTADAPRRVVGERLRAGGALC